MALPQRFATIGRHSTGEGVFHRILMEGGEVLTLRAQVYLECTPLARGEGLHLLVLPVGSGIFSSQLSAALDGVRLAAAQGLSRKLPLTDLRIALIDARFDPVESTTEACRMAGIFALVNTFEHGGEVEVL